MGWAEQKHLVWARTWRPNEKLSSSTMISPRSPSITDDLHADVALSRFFCHCKVRSRFWWFFKSFLGESKITGKFEMTFVSWNRWLETFLVFFLASTLDSLAEAWLALLVSCLQNPFLFICTWNCLSYFPLTFAIIIGINCNFCPLNLGFICQAPFIASLSSFSTFN